MLTWITATFLIGGLFVVLPTTPAYAATTVIWPVDVTNGSWSVLLGYNAGDHTGSQLYGLDPARTDSSSAAVRSPVNGTIQTYTVNADNQKGRCLFIKLEGYVNREASLCHVDFQNGLLGQSVNQGDYLGTITPDGGNTHLHFNLREGSTPIPFTGTSRIQGCQEYPWDGITTNQWAGSITCSEKSYVFPKEPGGWWLGPTPDDGTTVGAGAVVPVNVHAEDKTGSGLQRVAITWLDLTKSTKWFSRTKWLPSGTTQTDFRYDVTMPFTIAL